MSLAPETLYYLAVTCYDDSDEESWYSRELEIVTRGEITNIDKEKQLFSPQKYALFQNYPNPFNPVTTIRYDLPAEREVTLSIYDISGKLVETLVSDFQPAGAHSVQWNSKAVSSGLYFYKLEAGDFLEVKHMILLR